MTEEEQIKQVLYDFEDGGLISRDIKKVLSCIADRVVGIGIGEQGFVKSLPDIRSVFDSEARSHGNAAYSLQYDRVELLIHGGAFANLCAEISLIRRENGQETRSHLHQSLVLVKQDGAWKICGMHASAPVLTVEDLEACPLRYAEKMLKDMRAKIGEEAYLAEEQYRRAVLSDTVAFYIVNFTGNYFEQCQINNGICARANPGTPYDEFVKSRLPEYVAPEDREAFLKIFSLDNVKKAIAQGRRELSCEYRFQCPDGPAVWMVTVIRLIEDCKSGEHKGIMYVKDIDRQKRREMEMQAKAEQDVMTGLFNKNTFLQRAEKISSDPSNRPAAFLMIDVDKFKNINDSFGHPCGDHVLTETGRLIRECFGKRSTGGRLGGDEFGVLLTGPEAERKQIGRCVSSLFMRLSQMQVAADPSVQISCSIGAAYFQGADSFYRTYQHADQAMYLSKREGRNLCSFYEDSH